MIYTKTGDEGTTSLVGGTRVPKYDDRIEAYGAVDELNSYIGLVAATCDKTVDVLYIEQLKGIQRKLFIVQTLLGTEDKVLYQKLPQLPLDAITTLENYIDAMEIQLPKLNSFIIPGGSILSAHTHIARCICRRSERRCIKLAAHQTIATEICIYLNRLSDYLFVLSRMFLLLERKKEDVWKSGE